MKCQDRQDDSDALMSVSQTAAAVLSVGMYEMPRCSLDRRCQYAVTDIMSSYAQTRQGTGMLSPYFCGTPIPTTGRDV